MQFSSALLESAVSEFARLPGIGKKTALRLVLHLLRADPASVQGLSEALVRMKQEIKFCQRCHNVADGDICSICSNSFRKQEMICVVETIREVIAIESTQQYNGTYHVLGGIISPLDGVGPDQLNIETLVGRVRKERPAGADLCIESDDPGGYHHLLYPEEIAGYPVEDHDDCPGDRLWRGIGVCG